MDFELALILAMVFGIVGLITFFCIRPIVKSKCNKKILTFVCYIVSILGISLYFSFLILCVTGEHLNSSSTYEEIDIDKLTLHSVYFDDMSCDLDDTTVFLEEPNEKYNNIVLVEKENYEFQWIFKVKANSKNKYHIYLDENVYKRLNAGLVIYQKED